MITEAQIVRAIKALWILSATQVMLRLLALLGGLVALSTVAIAGRLPLWGWLLSIVFILIGAASPDSDAGMLAVLLILLMWLWRVGDVGTPWTPLAAVSLLLMHTAAAAAASIPPRADLPRVSLLRWSRRFAVVTAMTLAAWALGWAFSQAHAPGQALLTVAALSAVGVGALMLRKGATENQVRPGGADDS